LAPRRSSPLALPPAQPQRPWKSRDWCAARRYPLEQVDQGYKALARGEIAGRAIIEMS